MTDNLVRLDLSHFSSRDLRKIDEIGGKMELLHRRFRAHRVEALDGEAYAILYSGDRSPRQYASYQIVRRTGGAYCLLDGDGGEALAEARTIDAVIDDIPDDFYYTKR